MLPADAASAGVARRCVRAWLQEWGWDAAEEVATLLVSELVTNALLHAHTDISLRVQANRRRLRVEVRDGNPRLPEMRRYARSASTGRGLRLVDELAERWGVEPGRDGKTVWFEVGPRPREVPAPEMSYDATLAWEGAR